ncbi:hypothetical protein GALMADRAFT_1344135, partial [Galerina marginata CBS 339.88]
MAQKVSRTAMTPSDENPPTETEAAKSAQVPSNPNRAHHPTRLIIQFLPNGIDIDKRMDSKTIVNTVNEALAENQGSSHLKIVAASYNKQGNLILSTIGGQTAAELAPFADLFKAKIAQGQTAEAREDKRWFKIQVDGLSTVSVTIDGLRGVYSPDSVHEELAACNPIYSTAKLNIVSRPRWMRTVEETRRTTRSSVVFAVDSESMAKKILSRKTLAAFGRHCTLRAYQDRPPITQCKKCWGWDHIAEKCKAPSDTCRLCSEEHSEAAHPVTECTTCLIMEANGDMVTEVDGVGCDHNHSCTNCKTAGADAPSCNHTADLRRCPVRLSKYGTARGYERKAEQTGNPWRAVAPAPNPVSKAKPRLLQMLETPDEPHYTQPIRIAQLNAQRKKDVVINLLNEHINDFDIILLQEPAWGFIGSENGKDIVGPVALQGWIPIIPITKSTDTRPRTMAYYRQREDFEITLRTDILEDRDGQILDINQQGQPRVTIINTYNDTPGLKRRCILNRLRRLNLENNHATIITGDFNLHHDLWSARPVVNDQLTEKIVDWLSEKGFALLNPKGEITHPQRNRNERPSVIDLTFANGQAVASNIVQEWAIDPSLAHDSDHYGIKFTINHTPVEIHNITGEKYSLKDVDMDVWTKAIEDEMAMEKRTLDLLLSEDPLTEDSLDECEQALTKCILNTIASAGKQGWATEKLESATSNDIWGFQDWSKGARNYPTPPISTGEGTPKAVSHKDKCEAIRRELYQPPPELETEFQPNLTDRLD